MPGNKSLQEIKELDANRMEIINSNDINSNGKQRRLLENDTSSSCSGARDYVEEVRLNIKMRQLILDDTG